MTKELDEKLEKLQHLNFFGLYLWLGLVTISLSLFFFTRICSTHSIFASSLLKI